ncbi:MULTISPECIES: YesL family protein [Miniimonas]|uniref:YesL family protein n=1 Tax=Miniimonas TaxID=947525 RepID=UPI00131ED809|nr:MULTISPECIES: DUF624 domain-containing protein [Miniimonas]
MSTSIFEADSALLRFLSKVADVMVLNLVFVLTSLPIVTIGASLTALNYTALRIVDGECESVLDCYRRSFRQNLRQATVLFGIVVGLAVVLVAWFLIADGLAIASIVRFALYIVLFLVTFQAVIGALFVFPYLAKFEGSTREVLGNARKMSLRHLFASLAFLLTTGLPVVITIFYPHLVGYGLLWLAFGFAAIAVVNAFLFSAIFAKYVPTAPEGVA